LVLHHPRFVFPTHGAVSLLLRQWLAPSSLVGTPWRVGDTLRICPTTNGGASVRIFPSPQGGDVLGCTVYGRSSTPSSTCSRAAAPVEATGPRLPALEDRLRLVVQEMAHRRDVGASEHRAAREPAFAAWQGQEPRRRDRRLPIREDDRSRRRAKRLRRWQEGPRPQEAPAGGY
jgi:hypothetical protein